jgi:protein-S-isoprenylcysteine O-methyltransferase Ste14
LPEREFDLSSDDLFRLILVIIFFGFLPFGLYHRIRSNMSREKLDRWQEGAFILFGLRLSGLPWFIGGIVWMIDPKFMAWASIPIPLWMRWCGFILIAIWGALFVWTFQTLGKNLTDTVVTRAEHTLVTTGPYRFVRHPFYLAFAIALAGGSIVTANWFLFVSGLLPFAFLLARTRIEEEKLVERFGDEYRDYMQKTGRFWPRLRLH